MLRTDVHCHLLPGIDDGSRAKDESLIMARGLAELGVQRLHVTPHQFRMGNDLAPSEVRDRVAEVQAWLDDAGIGLRLHASAEHLFSERFLEALDREEELLTWGTDDAPDVRHVLIELPIRVPAVGVGAVARRLAACGIQPVMAHPERIEMIQRQPSSLERWRQAGWRYQLDLLSLVGAYGKAATRLSSELLKIGAYAFVGSDLHRPAQLEPLARAHARFRRLAGTEILE